MRVLALAVVLATACASAPPVPSPILPAAEPPPPYEPAEPDIPPGASDFPAHRLPDGCEGCPGPGYLLSEASVARALAARHERDRLRAHLESERARGTRRHEAFEAFAERAVAAQGETQEALARAQRWWPWIFLGGVMLGAAVAVGVAHALPEQPAGFWAPVGAGTAQGAP